MLPNKSDCRKINQSKKSKIFCNEFKGKKSGKAYYDYVEECKRKQELLIKQKLEEVKSGVKLEPNTSNVNYTNCVNKIQEIEELVYKKEKVELPFKSDGSFLEQFLKMQDSTVTVLEKPDKQFKHYEQNANFVEGEAMLGKVESKPPSKRSNKCLEDENEEIITPEDPKVLIAIENLVNQASLLPQNLQLTYIKQFEDQEEYWFLTLADSIEYSYFHWRLEEAKLEYLKKIEETNDNFESNHLNSNSSSSVRKRKSRWSTEVPKLLLVSVISPNSQILTDSQKQQMEYQKELQAMHEFITAQQKAKEQELMNSIAGITYGPAKTKSGHFKFEYDSDEDIKEGTWEHKLRKEEMEATRDWADKLTEMGQGKHHIGDFLPPEELDRFMETFRALKEGREPDYSDYTTFKITCENVGFKMLKKMGWKEGDGLGSDGQGIKVPLCNGPIKADNVGIGVKKMSKLTKFDDEYDAYRKRMMLAYRFRPNPLNNPRRDYY